VVASGTASTLRVDAGKSAQRLAVIECIFERFVSQGIPLLEKVNAQHPLDADRRPPALAMGIMRLDHRTQPWPRHDLLHLAQKALPARDLLLPGIL